VFFSLLSPPKWRKTNVGVVRGVDSFLLFSTLFINLNKNIESRYKQQPHHVGRVLRKKWRNGENVPSSHGALGVSLSPPTGDSPLFLEKVELILGSSGTLVRKSTKNHK
jgi:hypothetical protein